MRRESWSRRAPIAPVPRTTFRALAALLLLVAATAHAQFGGDEVPTPAQLVHASAAPVAIQAGGTAEATVTLEILSGWHINANPPAQDMIPTEASVIGAGGVSARPAIYPPPRQAQLSFSEEAVLVWDGTAALRIPLAAAKDAVNGTHELKGTIRFQSCNDQVCLPPASIPFRIAVTVSGGVAEGATQPGGTGAPAESAGRAPPSESAEPGAGAPTAQSFDSTQSGAHTAFGAGGSDPGQRLRGALEGGALGWFLALFVGGLALNLTPCVFPMLGITVSVFGARRKEPPAKVLLHAITYVIGIALTYSVLGVVAALTGGLFGAALQNAWVNVALGALLVVLALSMFGLYEFQPPASLLTKLGGADTSSLIGIFFSGLVVGIIAAPCVGPFVVAVLAIIAQRGDAAFGFQTMFAMSLGLGFPYLFLAVFSNLLQSLPRSGDWMLWVKKVFGVLLTAIGLNYVLVGLAPEWAPWVLPVALVLGGGYLGFVDRHGSQKPAFRTFKWALGVVGIIAGLIAGDALRAEGLRFEHYREEAVRAAFASGRPVMMDFSATWCAPCHELDRITFTHASVKSLGRRFATFKVDLTRYDSPESQALRKRFGVTGVPEVLFFTPDGNEVRVARVIGFMPPEPFLDRMRYVLDGTTAGRLGANNP